MQLITIEEIIQYKILPFNVYSQNGDVVLASGEILTSGKLLQLRQSNKIYINDEEIAKISGQTKDYDEVVAQEETGVNIYDEPIVTPIEMESFESIISQKQEDNPKDEIDKCDISTKDWHFNKDSKIEPVLQMKLQAYYQELIEEFRKTSNISVLNGFLKIRNRILEMLDTLTNQAFLSSQVKILGDYEYSHEINTAMYSAIVAQKMEMTQQDVADIILGALLHDIGKLRIEQKIVEAVELKNEQFNVLKEHTKIGYKIIKNEFKLSETMAKMALEHHENSNGSGYPFGKSIHQMKLPSKIIAVCNYFDNLTSNKTSFHIKTNKEALRKMLEMGSQIFAADVLYTFINSYKYNDTIPIEEMKM